MWQVKVLSEVVETEIRTLPDDMRARLARVIDIIEANGIQAVPRDAVRHLEDKLWELRVRGRDGISRAIYVTSTGQLIIIVRVFIKKTQKTPTNELRLARQRAREIK